jgi:heme/copper-type cytochrome/quinol oxidase subunit 2
MQMKFVVESEEDYNKWINSQKTVQNTLTLK